MPLLGTTTKQPAETEKYSIYYGDDVSPTDNISLQFLGLIAIDESTTGLPTIDSYVVDSVGQRVNMLISGGTAGVVYKITVRVITDTGRVLEDEFKLRIKEY